MLYKQIRLCIFTKTTKKLYWPWLKKERQYLYNYYIIYPHFIKSIKRSTGEVSKYAFCQWASGYKYQLLSTRQEKSEELTRVARRVGALKQRKPSNLQTWRPSLLLLPWSWRSPSSVPRRALLPLPLRWVLDPPSFHSLSLHLKKSHSKEWEAMLQITTVLMSLYVPHTVSKKRRWQSRLFLIWGSIQLHSHQRRSMQPLLQGVIVPAPNSSAQLWFPSKMQFLKLVLWIFVWCFCLLLFYRLTVICFSLICFTCFSK